MKVCIIGHSFNYEIEKVCRLFLPFEKIEFIDEVIDGDQVAVTILEENKAFAGLSLNGEKYCTQENIFNINDNRECERVVASLLFKCFVHLTGYSPKWGIVTGIRPARLFSAVCDEFKSKEEAKDYFKEKFFVDKQKISLCEETHLSEEKIINLSSPKSFSLYVSIPFCPSRCSYCSFVSHSIEKASKLIPQYVDYLLEEIIKTADISRSLGLKLETVYVGGGTPTTLEPEFLEKLLSTLKDNFDFSSVREFTVEAGRPDTITKEKLTVLKNFGVERISINPQTLNDDVLNIIGRKHTVADFYNAFKIAREVGFDCINTDIIAGLPGDSLVSFKNTLENILKLSPENVTVHALSMKRSSKLNVTGAFPEIEVGRVADEMVSFARNTLSANKINPYYMYRQSKTVGNLENVGYSIKNKECLYNVYIMDETHTILGCGASAVTKLKEPYGKSIERIFNFKYPYEYINRYDEMIARKKGIVDFYNKFSPID